MVPRTMLLLLGLALACTVTAQELGRLFTNPGERSALNQLRREAQFARPQPEQAPVQEQAEAPREPEGPSVSRLEINGIVRRSGGPATVWVNGAYVERGVVSREGLRVDPGRRIRDGVQVRLPSGVRTVRLKPGQAIDVATGTLVDAYERSPESGGATAFALEAKQPESPESASAQSATAVPATPPETEVAPAAPPVALAPAPLTPEAISAMSEAERSRALNMLLDAGSPVPQRGTAPQLSRPAAPGQ